MKALGWILLIVGIALAGAGGARNGLAMADVYANRAPLEIVEGAQKAVQDARTAVTEAKAAEQDAEDPEAAKAAVEAARQALAEAEAEVVSLREQGLVEGSLQESVERLQAAVPASPAPGARLLDWLITGGPWWGGGVVLVAIGSFLARRAQAQESRAPSADGQSADFPGTIERVLLELEQISAQIAELPMDAPSTEIREHIDRIQDELLTPLVDARAQLQARHGTQRFSVYFGTFSAGERNLARVWSALTDGHSVVARESLARSQAEFRQALADWARAEDG